MPQSHNWQPLLVSYCNLHFSELITDRSLRCSETNRLLWKLSPHQEAIAHNSVVPRPAAHRTVWQPIQQHTTVWCPVQQHTGQYGSPSSSTQQCGAPSSSTQDRTAQSTGPTHSTQLYSILGLLKQYRNMPFTLMRNDGYRNRTIFLSGTTHLPTKYGVKTVNYTLLRIFSTSYIKDFTHKTYFSNTVNIIKHFKN